MANSRSLRSDTLLDRLRAWFGKRVAAVGEKPLKLTVAFSGGLDSTVLLFALAKLCPEFGFSLVARHVHHGLSPHADVWAAQCAGICRRLGVSLSVTKVAVARDSGRGTESAARDARYAVLQAGDGEWIVLAHHADDQAETLLHRLVRGCGVDGAAAMHEVDAERRLWRPLLTESRSELRAWADAEGLQWIEDDSNSDQRYTRNFLRHALLAPLSERLPFSVANLGRAARHFAEAAELLRERAMSDAKLVGAGTAGARVRFRSLPDAAARNLLRYWLAGADKTGLPSTGRLEECLSGIRGDRPFRWCYGQVALAAYRQRLWFEPVTLAAPVPRVWQGESALDWGGGRLLLSRDGGDKGLSIDPGMYGLCFGMRREGERLRIAADRPNRDLRALCQDAGIPHWWRDRLPVLRLGDEIVWVGGIGAAARFKGGAGSPGWSIAWQDPVFAGLFG